MAVIPSFAVIIPMYNEESGAELCVVRVCGQLATMENRAHLIVVNDGSKDRTASILDSQARRFDGLTVIHHPVNCGYGAALRTGIERAADHGYDYCVFMDSDLTNDPADLPRFAEKMASGFDVIKASRFANGGGMKGVPFRRSIVSRSGNLVARMLFGLTIRDCTNGFRAVKTEILRKMQLTEPGFPIIVEELYYSKFLARSFAEVPVVLSSRSADQRPTSFTYNRKTIQKYFSFAWRAFLNMKPAFLKESE